MINGSLKKIVEETKSNVLSGVCAVHIATDDYPQFDEFVDGLAGSLGFAPVEWNYGEGLVDFHCKSKIDGKAGLADALRDIMYDAEYARKTLFVIKNARLVLEGEQNGKNLAQLQQIILRLKKYNSGMSLIVYTDETRFMPNELSSLVYFVELTPPASEELTGIIEDWQSDSPDKVPPDLALELSKMCVGMSEDSFRQVLSKAAEKKNEFSDALRIAANAKKQFVRKSGLLEFIDADVNIEKDVGGIDNLISWLKLKREGIKRADEARKSGISPAKGVLLLGMPGCGKSLTAKGIAGMFDVPLLKLDLGSLMGKYLGQSEENLRRALTLAQNSSPCVLWVDEIEKALAGVGGDETGVSQRLFGYLLTWLQDNKKPVFVVATANDITVLPPEFLRRGRFDELFSIGFPEEKERARIFEIHIGKKAMEKESIDCAKLAAHKNAKGCAGSDIEAVVNSAAERAWKNGKPLSQALLEQELEHIKPLSVSLKDKIAKMQEKLSQYDLRPACFTKDDWRGLETLCESRDPEDRKAAAGDERCPEYLLLKIAAEEKEAEVKITLLENPNCPLTVIRQFRNDGDKPVRDKANEKYIKSTERIKQNEAPAGGSTSLSAGKTHGGLRSCNTCWYLSSNNTCMINNQKNISGKSCEHWRGG